MAAAAAILLAAPAPAASASPQVRTFSIPAQSLDDALTRFGASTGLQLLYDASLASGRRSAAVEGVMEPRQALVRLLEGTGLFARFTSGGAVVIYASSSSSAVVLNPITAVAAPLVGRRDDGAMRAYADRARLRVAEAVRRDPELTRDDVLVRLRLRLNAEGRVSDAVIQEGTGGRGVGRPLSGPGLEPAFRSAAARAVTVVAHGIPRKPRTLTVECHRSVAADG